MPTPTKRQQRLLDTPGKYGPKLFYEGRVYSLDKGQTGKLYYRNATTGLLLHRIVWEAERGEIPEGYHIHHANGNTLDNNIANLVCLSPSEHKQEHEPSGIAAWDSTKRSQSTKEQWKRKEPRLHICDGCGAEFYSTCTRARWCGKSCRRKYHRAKERAKERAARLQSSS